MSNEEEKEEVSMSESSKEISFLNDCMACMDKKPDSIFRNCGHGGLCYICAIDIWQKKGVCHLCRKEIVRVDQIEIIGENTPNHYYKVCTSTKKVKIPH